jgi:hypothetical protein
MAGYPLRVPRDESWSERLVVRPEKLVDYLLSPSHKDGRHKQQFFEAHGFSIERPGELADALIRHAATAVELADATTRFGRKWVLRGRLLAPDGREPVVQSVWIQPFDESNVRLVTAYPVRGDRR